MKKLFEMIKKGFQTEPVRASIFCLFLGFLLYFPSLSTPWSLVDAGRFIHYSDEAFSKLETDGAGTFLSKLIKIRENYVGPTIRFLIAFQRVVFGNSHWIWHLARILSFALFLGAVWTLARMAGGNILSSSIAILAAALFGPQQSFPDFHSYYANFARFFTSDSYQIPFTLWASVFLILGLFSEGGKRKLIFAGFFICLFLCCLCKMTALHVIAAMIVFTLLVIVMGRGAVRKRAAFYLGATTIASVPGLLFFRPWNPGPITGYENVEIYKTPGAIWGNLSEYLEYTTDSLGYLWYLALLLSLIAVLRLFLDRSRDKKSPDRERSVIMLLLGLFLSGLTLQSTWSINLPRYMINFVPFLCILFGVEIGRIIAILSVEVCEKPSRGCRFPFAIAGLILTCFILFPYYYPIGPTLLRQYWVFGWTILAGSLCVAGLFLIWKKRKGRYWGAIRLVPLTAIWGMLLFQGVVQIFSTLDSAINYYMYEKAYSSILKEAADLNKDLPGEERGTIYMNLKGEPLWSIDMILHHTGMAPRVDVRPLSRKEIPNLGKNDRIFIIHDYNSYGILLVPAFSGGKPIGPLLQYGEKTRIGWVREGDSLELPIVFPEPITVTHIALGADPFSWPTCLDLDVTFHPFVGGSPREIARFEGIRVTRSRMGPLVEHLPEPFLFPRAPGKIVLKCEKTEDSRFLFSRPAAGFMRIAVIHSKPGGHTDSKLVIPRIHLWGYKGRAGYQRYRNREFRVHSLLVASPAHLFRSYHRRLIPPRGWFVNSLRRINYSYTTELYGPAVKDKKD